MSQTSQETARNKRYPEKGNSSLDSDDPTAFRISHLCEMLESYLEMEQVAEVYLAPVGDPPAAVRHHIERGRIYAGTGFLTPGHLMDFDPLSEE